MKNIFNDELYEEINNYNYITTNELKELGLNDYYIEKLRSEGTIIRVAKGYYKTSVRINNHNFKKEVLKQAREKIELGHYEEAEQIIRNYKHFEKSKKAHYTMYQLLVLKGDYLKAKEELMKSILLSKVKDREKEYSLLMLNELIEKDKEIETLKKLNKKL